MNKSLKAKILEAILFLNKTLKSSIHERTIDLVLKDLTSIKAMCDNEAYERMIEYNYHASLSYVCDSLHKWYELEEGVQQELYKFLSEIHAIIKIKTQELDLLKNEDIIHTLNIFRYYLQSTGRL